MSNRYLQGLGQQANSVLVGSLQYKESSIQAQQVRGHAAKSRPM